MTCRVFERVTLANGSAFMMHVGATKSEEELLDSDICLSSNILDCDKGFAPYYIRNTMACLRDVRTMSVDELKQLFVDKESIDYSRAVASLSSGYTPEERDTWARQVDEATKFQATGASALIESLADARKEKPADVAAKILAKAKAFEDQKLALFVKHTEVLANLDKAKTVADLPVLDEDTALAILPLGTFKSAEAG